MNFADAKGHARSSPCLVMANEPGHGERTSTFYDQEGVTKLTKAGRIAPARRLSSTVYDEVKQQIISGAYRAGDKLIVEELCASFQVSRAPVMDALRRLSSEWFVEIIPQVGCRVATYDTRSYREFIATFGEMEGNIAALASKRRTDDQIARAEELLGELEKRTKLDSKSREINRAIHSLILEMSQSDILNRLCEQMWDFGDFIFMTIANDVPDADILSSWLAPQRGLIDAIKERNGALAKLHMTVWLTGVLKNIPESAGEPKSDEFLLQDR